ncbi:MAG: hypothetical protein IT535_02300 [Bauldia sp.]|nr:hypothetical protein [Bauldia sp.]
MTKKIRPKTAQPSAKSRKTALVSGFVGSKDADAFEVAAKEYTKAAVASKETAIKALQRSGYLTKSGKIASPYR